jgi:hypothetical protein
MSCEQNAGQNYDWRIGNKSAENVEVQIFGKSPNRSKIARVKELKTY